MQRVCRRLTRASRLALLLLLAAPWAHAQAIEAVPDCPEQDATLCGRRHFEAGTKAFEQGDFATAAAEFQTALAQRPHAVIRFNLALSFARLGHPQAAIAQLKLVQADSAADKSLRERATGEQRSAEQALARVSFRLSDPTREHVELDGAQASPGNGGDVALDPGAHHVRVISGSAIVLDQDLELAPGERVELRVGERSRRIDVVVVPEAATNPPKKQTSTPLRGSGQRTLSPGWFYAAAGTTLVVAGLTVVSGLDTQHAYDDYQRGLPQLTQQGADDRVKHGHALELRTNLLLAGSVLCGAGTAVLGVWFVDFSGHRQASVGVAPNGVTVAGRF